MTLSDDSDNPDFAALRRLMVERQLIARGIRDENVLAAFEKVERHLFIDPCSWDEAYEDHPVGIGCSQTISQPYIVALMTERLQVQPGMKVLEIGTGSGYQTAILAALGAQVCTVERHEELTERAAAVLEKIGLDESVEFFVGDGSLGEPEEAPYDRIIVTAAAPECPEALKEQLSPDSGRMLIPVGHDNQDLLVITRNGDKFTEQNELAVIFVPLIGEQGF